MNDKSSSTSPPSLATTKSSQVPPELILVLTPRGVERAIFNTSTAEEQIKLERLLQLIQPGLDAVSAIWQQGSAVQTV